MKFRILKGASLILAAVNYCDFQYTKGDYGYGTVDFEPMIYGYNYNFKLFFQARPIQTDAYFQRIYFCSDIKSNLSLYVGPIDGAFISNPMSYTLSANALSPDPGRNRLYMIRTRAATRCGLPIRADFQIIHPFSINLPQDTPDYTFTEPLGSRIHFYDSALNEGLVQPTYYQRSYSFSGFGEDIECEGGIMPFGLIPMYGYDAFHEYTAVTMKNPYMLITRGAEKFSIGEEVPGPHGEIYRKIPLKITQAQNKLSYFSLERKYYLDLGTNRMREATTTMKSGEISTELLFFPYDENFKPLTYGVEIHGSDFCGLRGCDFSYSFNAITKVRNFGGCLSSQYCIGVV